MDRASARQVRAIGEVILGQTLIAVEVDPEPMRKLVRVARLVLAPGDALDPRRFRAGPRTQAPPIDVQVGGWEADARDRVPHANVVVTRTVERHPAPQAS